MQFLHITIFSFYSIIASLGTGNDELLYPKIIHYGTDNLPEELFSLGTNDFIYYNNTPIVHLTDEQWALVKKYYTNRSPYTVDKIIFCKPTKSTP